MWEIGRPTEGVSGREKVSSSDNTNAPDQPRSTPNETDVSEGFEGNEWKLVEWRIAGAECERWREHWVSMANWCKSMLGGFGYLDCVECPWKKRNTFILNDPQYL